MTKFEALQNLTWELIETMSCRISDTGGCFHEYDIEALASMYEATYTTKAVDATLLRSVADIVIKCEESYSKKAEKKRISLLKKMQKLTSKMSAHYEKYADLNAELLEALK